MVPSPQTQAILLLTASLGRADSRAARPLSDGEWARFAIWLKDHELAPDSLLRSGWRDVVAGWTDPAVPLVRLEALLNRGAALGFALEKWQRAGVWVLTRADAEYPVRLKKRLRARAPAVLFGCGNRRLLNAGGVAVVGSREAGDDDLRFAGELGGQAARQESTVVSGAARGVDQAAMLGALESDGTAVGVLADSLLRSATSTRYRKHLMSHDLVLVTPFNPEARFHVGNAMSRNKYIYCLADAGVAVCSKPGRGGTWTGAIENLDASWVPLWVRRDDDSHSGNAQLVKHGARWLPSHLGSDLLIALSPACAPERDAGSPTPGVGRPANREPEVTLATPRATGADGDAADGGLGRPDFYRLFLDWMDAATASGPIAADAIAKRLALKKTQIAAWLSRGIAEERVRKLTKPVRYAVTHRPDPQASFLRDRE